MAIRKIDVQALVPGLYVRELDRPWTETPFLFQGFEIRDSDEIAVLRQYCRFVWVDTEASRAPMPERPADANRLASPLTQFRQGLAATRRTRRELIDILSALPGRLRSDDPEILQDVSPSLARFNTECLRRPEVALWLNALRESDHRLMDHGLNVCSLSLLLAHQLGVSTTMQATVSLGGLLHDIGKLTLPRPLIFEPRRLSVDDHELIATCPAAGSALLARSGFDERVQRIVALHQERMDGSGFPDGLKGETAVPLAARIVGLANAYDAMTADWPRRPGLSGHQALILLGRKGPDRWGRKLVDTLTRLMGVYPPGTPVHLDTGAQAMVVGSTPANRLRPMVVVYRTAQGRHPDRLALLDLAVPGNKHRIAAPLSPDSNHPTRMQQITTQLLAA